MIKNAIVYSVEMPTIDHMRGFVQNFLSVRPGPHSQKTIGFAPHSISKEVVTGFEGGYCVTVLEWEKKIDTAAVREELNSQMKYEEERTGQPLNKKQKDYLKEDIIQMILPNILPSPKYTHCYFHTASKTLIVDTCSDKTSDNVTALLRKAIGSLKATTLYVDSRGGLTERFTQCLEAGTRRLVTNPETSDCVDIRDDIQLVGGEGQKMKCDDVNLFDEQTAEELAAQIREGGMHLKSIGLTNRETNFVLTDGFKFKSIKFDDFDDTQHRKDSLEAWQASTLISVDFVSKVSKLIVDEFTVVEE